MKIKIYLVILILFVSNPTFNTIANESVLNHISFGDIKNIAIGGFNLKKDSYLFSLPKDNPPTDRGVVWGEMFVFDDKGAQHSFVSIFNCGLVTSHLGPYLINFSKEDKYLAVESGGEGGSVIDIFEVSALYTEPLEKAWNGTDLCVKPVATLGSYNMPVTFQGWDGSVPMVKSTIPLNQFSTAADVIEFDKQGKCCVGEPQIFAWDFYSNQFKIKN